MIGRSPGGAALLGGQHLAGLALAGLGLPEGPAQGPVLLAQLAQLLPDPGQFVTQLVGLDLRHGPVVLGPGNPLLGAPDQFGDHGAVHLGLHRRAGRLDQVPPARWTDQVGERGDLDPKHTVFGKCAELDVVKKIARVKTTNDKPDVPVTMNKVTITKG